MIVIAAIVGLAVGFAIAKFLEKGKASKTIINAKKDAERILKDANAEGESVKKEKILQAKEKFLELKAEHEKVINTKDKKINDAEKRTRDKEFQVSSELAKNKSMNAQLDNKLKEVEQKRQLFERFYFEEEKVNF